MKIKNNKTSLESYKDSILLTRMFHNVYYEESDRYEDNRQNNGNDN